VYAIFTNEHRTTDMRFKGDGKSDLTDVAKLPRETAGVQRPLSIPPFNGNVLARTALAWCEPGGSGITDLHAVLRNAHALSHLTHLVKELGGQCWLSHSVALCCKERQGHFDQLPDRRNRVGSAILQSPLCRARFRDEQAETLFKEQLLHQPDMQHRKTHLSNKALPAATYVPK
jgi:hypothetical protein